MRSMVIVGAGQTGGRAALTLRAQGFDGRVVLIGEEPHPPYERPPLSKAFLKGERELESFTFAPNLRLVEAGIEFRPGCRVEAIERPSRMARLSDGERLSYDRLLLATGRRVRRMSLPGVGADRVHYLRSVDDARRLRQALVQAHDVLIVGGGFIGLEVAASAVALGCRPCLVELAPRLLSRMVPAAIAQALLARHAKAGVDIRLGTGIERALAVDGRLAVTLTDGSDVTADLVLVGIGATPRSELAEAAGLAVDHGIVVDATLATSDPDILAAGDVCAFPEAGGLARLESWANAEAQGALAARNMLGAGAAHDTLPWFWSDQYELTLQMAGAPHAGSTVVERDVGPEARLLFHLDGSGRLVGVSGLGTTALARDLRIAQMMIERGLTPDPAALADPTKRLKAMLS
jgi:3-phenylpropionate/trans-cinnamate dioxygenase ferredoxin reductase subunit